MLSRPAPGLAGSRLLHLLGRAFALLREMRGDLLTDCAQLRHLLRTELIEQVPPRFSAKRCPP